MIKESWLRNYYTLIKKHDIILTIYYFFTIFQARLKSNSNWLIATTKEIAAGQELKQQ